MAFRYFFIIYFYICGVNTDSAKDMQTLLNDIELDIHELKCLVQAVSGDANPALRVVAKRNIQQMKARLDELSKLLDEAPVAVAAPPAAELPTTPIPHAEPTPLAEPAPIVEPAPPVRPVEPVVVNTTKVIHEQSVVTTAEPVPVQAVVASASTILAERIKPAIDLRHAISLNDSFRFTRELFGGDASRMNEVVGRLGAASSLDKAMDIFVSEVHPDDENESAADFIELLKKYFS